MPAPQRHKHFHNQSLRLAVTITTFLCLLTFLSTVQAANLVSGKYQAATGQNIQLTLTINSPAPINLIVQQQFSPSNHIIATSPKAKTTNAAQGKVKWLCKNTRNGNLTLSTSLKAPMNGRVSATVRYKNPEGGGFITLNISP